MSWDSTPIPSGSSVLVPDDSYVEDVTADVLAAANASGRYEPTSEPKHCAGFDYAVIDVPTPLDDGVPNLIIRDRRR